MLLYADKDFPFPVVEALRRLGHNILTAREDGHEAASDIVILARAHDLLRAVLTHNRRHFERRHERPQEMALCARHTRIHRQGSLVVAPLVVSVHP